MKQTTLPEYTKVPQGRINPDRSYHWECNHVNHAYSEEDCPWCCGYDLEKILESLKDSKSQVYYGNLKAFRRLKGKEIYDLAIAMDKEQGEITIANLLEIADLYGLRRRTKIICEWLEETHLLPSGTYANLKDRKLKPTKIPPSNPDRLEHLKCLIAKNQYNDYWKQLDDMEEEEVEKQDGFIYKEHLIVCEYLKSRDGNMFWKSFIWLPDWESDDICDDAECGSSRKEVILKAFSTIDKGIKL